MAYRKVNNFPAWANSTPGIKQNLKGLPGKHALRGVMASFFLGIKSSAGAFLAKCKPNDGTAVGGTDDRLTQMKALITRAYLRRDGEEKQWSLKPQDAEILYGLRYARCMLGGAAMFDGVSIPASGAAELLFRLDVVFDFTIPGETPDKFVGGTEQAQLEGGYEFSYDTDGTGIGALVLANGTAVMTIKNVVLGVDIDPVPHPIIGAPWAAQQDQEPTENYVKEEACIEELYETSLPATLDAAVTTITTTTDNLVEDLQATPGQLADKYTRERTAADGDGPFLVERSCSPIRFFQHRQQPDELQMPVQLSKRTVNFQGSTAVRNMIRKRILPFEKNAKQAEAVMGMYGVTGSWKDLPIRYAGGERAQVVDTIFGTRYLPGV